ncbi:redoxin family protein [Pseudomonas sp. MH9.2]|uniref:prolipoprotein diacylglyceryl transferase family protein n=1 Tax=Pseudomonas sp. MH9.2 TaxID=3048629 RepID=UPI002AC972BA|nr:prolipoprotein diacylglyceryl transferase family protein [Pseudomonas sp. MH9.2]MEB0028764.1 redoxin family protein [Pseudomonas sp. MH9.2]WPX70515.1 redoxin family protein [Pseudomonas sp. MH9.2]
MLSFSIGPFALAMNHVLLIAALGLATLVGWRVAKRGGINPESALFSLFVLGLLVARLGFVIAYWPQFREELWQIVDIRDGGFLIWPGVLAVILGGLWRGWRQHALRRPLGLGLSSGLLFWLLATMGLNIYQESARLPQLTLRNAAGESVQLADYTGKPLVINLWATWCPPCRREMPVLQKAQAEREDVVFLFVNQAESQQTVTGFIADQGLHLRNVLFDGSGKLAQSVGSMALPTTIFYTADGRLRGSHLGELSNASLARYLDNVDSDAPSSYSRTAP